ncbi:MAG TPA: hypothetical protein HPQ04_12350 [Rhodospirillaceae bacterium]|nr:hypothetical protein [Rhodospirillaceae bacterium]
MVLFLVALLPAGAGAEDVPFGLHWGDSVAFLTGKDIEVTVDKDDGQVKLCRLRNFRPMPPNTELVRVVIHAALGLQRIIWRSKDIADVPTGANGIAAYLDMKEKLSNDYGYPRTSSEESGASVYTSPSQFYQCLGSDGCGSYISRWNTDDGEAYLRLLPGQAPDSGRLEATYDGPRWPEVASGRIKK